jgi:hypothetical protein
MQEYFQCPTQQRPKIFGMTASPIWNPKDAQESLATLEKNLDSSVIAVREHTEELENFSPRPKEVSFLPFQIIYKLVDIFNRKSESFLPHQRFMSLTLLQHCGPAVKNYLDHQSLTFHGSKSRQNTD